MTRRGVLALPAPEGHTTPTPETALGYVGTRSRERPVRGARSEDDAADLGGPRLDYDRVQDVVREMLESAISYNDELSSERAVMQEYYDGDITSDVPDQEGRSTAVAPIAHDVILQILPSLVRIFLSAERVLRFVPDKPGTERLAKQRTDYVHQVLMEDNPGFMILLTAFQDALIKDTGILHWAADHRRTVQRQRYTGLTRTQVQMLAEMSDVEQIDAHVTEQVALPTDSLGDDLLGDVEPGPREGVVLLPLHDVSLVRVSEKAEVKVFAVPGEEFLISESAPSDIDQADLVGRRRLFRRDDLLAMGIPLDFIEEHGGKEGQVGFYSNAEYLDRHPNEMQRCDYSDDMARTLLTESYVRLVRDEQLGLPELCRVRTLGWNHVIVDIEEADEIPFAVLSPMPAPHRYDGAGVVRDVMPEMRIMSRILRSTLESLALAVHPRPVVNPDKVTMSDVLNTAVGSVIRATDPTAVTFTAAPFVGRDGMTMLDWFRERTQERTGILAPPDPQDLQSTNKKGLDITERQSTQRIELIARIFGETALKRMMMGIQRLCMRHQDVERTIQLRGEFVNVNPATWDSELGVTVKVGVGQGTQQERLMVLQGAMGEMKEMMTVLGPNNPITNLGRYRAVFAEALELSGHPDASMFMKEIPLDFEPEPTPPKPTDAELLAQTTQAKTQAEHAQAMAELDFKREELRLQDERERLKIALDAHVRMAIAQVSADKAQETGAVQTMLTLAERDSEAASQRHDAEQQVKQLTAETEQEIAAFEQAESEQTTPEPTQ